MKKLLIVFTIILSFVVFNRSLCEAARPLVTDDYGTVDPGKYELEVGHASTLNPVDPEDDDSFENTTYSGGIAFKGGIFPGLDLGVELPFNFSSPIGMNDSILHVKYRLIELAEDEGITLRSDIKVANRYEWEGYGTGDTDVGLVLIYSKKIGEFNTHYNFGYTCACILKGEVEGEEDDVTLASAAVEYPLFGDMGDAVAEIVALNAPHSNSGFGQIGIRHYVGVARLDAGYSFGLNKYSIKNCVTVGMTFEF
jgi:hypothetical protein